MKISLPLLLTCLFSFCTSITQAAPPMLHVVNRQLNDSKGTVVRLQGVNIPSLDWSSTGERLTVSVDRALTNWNAKIIRLPLSQDRWFGRAGDTLHGENGAAYRKVVDGVVRQVAMHQGYVLLDLHWSNGGKWGQNVGQHSMPDDNSIAFWKDIAARYANHPAVLFDLYNEPHDVSWDVWQRGGTVDERNGDPKRGLHLTYHTPGMQALLDTVRATGAKNVVVAGGLDWGYDLSGLVNGYGLHDTKGHGILYGTHIYPWKKDWDIHVTPAIAKVAVFVGEVGTKPWKTGDPPHENVYSTTWAPQVLTYMNQHKLSWTAWSFHPSANPCLITGWDYKPTSYWGVQVKNALAGKLPTAVALPRPSTPTKVQPKTEPTGKQLLTNATFAQGQASWVVEENGAKGQTEVVSEGPGASAALRLKVLAIGDASWRLQLYQPHLPIKKGAKYTLTFWVKAARTGVITVNCMQNHEPWEHHGAATELPVTTEWTPLQFEFEGPWDDTNARITFTNLGTEPGQTYWFAKASLIEREGAH